MRFRVFTIRREGVLKMRHCWMETSVVGRLEVTETYRPEFHRYCISARILGEDGNPIDGFSLHDAVLMTANDTRWTMRGIERHEHWPGQFRDYAQSWVLIPQL